MPKYFSNFGRVLRYDSNGNGVVATDIMKRVNVLKSVKDNAFVYYKYDIQDGDTPEMIAEKFYGDPERHWIVLYMNEIIDPYYDWPLSYRNFQEYINDKYYDYANNISGLAWSESHIHHIEKNITKTDSVDGSVTNETYIISDPIPHSVVSKGTITIDTSSHQVTYYDWEQQLNEAKRTIKLLKAEYASQVEDELVQLMSK